MPTYTTISETADLVQGKTQAFKILTVSDDVDLGLFWQKAGGVIGSKVKATLVRPNGTQVTKQSSDGEILVVNTNPPKIKILFSPSDLNFVGDLKIYPEFQIDDSWIQSDMILLVVIDDATAGA